MPEAVLIAVLILALFVALAASIVGITALRGRKDDGSAAPALREEFDRSRAEAQATAKDLRGELSESVTRMGQQLSGQVTQIATVQNNQIDAFSRQLVELTPANERRLAARKAQGRCGAFPRASTSSWPWCRRRTTSA